MIVVVAWNLLYHLLLKPLGIPDDQLTKSVQTGAMKLLSFFYNDIAPDGTAIRINGTKSVNIARQCNGLELMILYLGFIICVPTNTKRMLSFAILGTIIIYILNVIRTAWLASLYFNGFKFADIAHHFVFKIVIYAVVFFGWVLYMRKNK
ncbi:MAG: archaeosortase/exosortase family protein [Chitinophagaceae bacterium]|nr:archaeosortase/exosortase family protein [Chitinophagaceae bacterium]